MHLNEIATKHNEWVERMGWHNKTVLEALALIASEVGEDVVAVTRTDSEHRIVSVIWERKQVELKK